MAQRQRIAWDISGVYTYKTIQNNFVIRAEYQTKKKKEEKKQEKKKRMRKRMMMRKQRERKGGGGRRGRRRRTERITSQGQLSYIFVGRRS